MITIYIATLSNLLWNLVNIAVKRISRGTKCRAQTHNNREAVFVWVAPVVANRVASGGRYTIKMRLICVYTDCVSIYLFYVPI